MPDEAPSRTSAAAGDVIAGKYRLEREVARGGMGVVWAARHDMLSQQVAIKMLLGESAVVPHAAERFVREARAAARLRSDHVVRIFDVGLLPTGMPYMAMELLDGIDLDEATVAGPLPVTLACDYLLQALEAIGEAHAAGIVHRDLKPSNLFIAKRPGGVDRLKVLDFGISKLLGDTVDGAITSTKTLLGSPGYMSPEHVRSAKNVDPRTDLWSLGVILHEVLTGKTLFPGETVGEIFAKILSDPIPSPRSRQPDLPAELDAVIMKCLERERDARFATADELKLALLPFASPPPSSVRSLTAAADTRVTVEHGPKLDNQQLRKAAEAMTVQDDAQPPRVGSTSLGGVTGSAFRKGPSRRTRVALVAVAGVALVGVGVWVASSTSGRTPSVMSSATAVDPPSTASSAPIAPPPPAIVESPPPATAASASPAVPSATAAPKSRPVTKPPARPTPPSGRDKGPAIAAPLVGRE